MIGVDLSLNATGVADDHGCWTIRTSSGDPLLARIVQIRDMLLSTLLNAVRVRDTRVVVIEDLPPVRAYSLAVSGMLHGAVRVALMEHEMRVMLVPPAVLKRYATGKGNASKSEMLAEAVRRFGYQGADHNEADALWLRDLGLSIVSGGMQVKGVREDG